MSERFRPERLGNPSTPDWGMLSILVLLAGAGIALLFSSSYFRADLQFGDPLFFLKRRTLYLFLGLGLAALAARISLRFVRRGLPVLIGVALLLMLLTFVPGIRVDTMGAHRWIQAFGMSFQPSELVKPVVIIYLAHMLEKKREQFDDPARAILPPFLVLLVFSGLIYLQNDFSTAIFVFVMGVVMFFVGGLRLRYFLGLGLMTLPMAGMLLLTREHRVERLIAFLDPARDPLGSGFHLRVSRSALASGGLWGQGVGESSYKLGILPESNSDFIFAVVGEELGFLGVSLVVGLFALFALKGYSIARRSQGRFEYYLAFGLTTSIVLQALVNMAVVSGLVPATGIPLPFFSAGGSSMIMTMAMCGLLLNVSRRSRIGEAEGG